MHTHRRDASTPGSDTSSTIPSRDVPGAQTQIEAEGLTRVFREAAPDSGARDDNGVAAGADAAIDRASGSTGSALPGSVQQRFEGSLGADLSGVRVHTGSDSVAAASAVGARAYTVGQDIHFNEGQYDPQSADGQHLLAHEVAHTVQQQGVARKIQYKLEVSSPGDALELEADRAADAMLGGEAALVSGASGIARKTIQRDEMSEDEYVKNKVKGAENDAKAAQNDPTVVQSVGATFSIDKNAQKEIADKVAQVEGWTKAMDEQQEYNKNGNGSAMNSSGAGSDITPEKLGDNVHAAIVLKEYAAQVDNEGSDLGAIKNQHAVVQVDYTRALASINAAASMYSIDLTKTHGDGAAAAQKMADGMGVDPKQSEQFAVKNKEAVSQLTQKANDYNKTIGEMKSAATDIKAQAAGMKSATAKFRVHTLQKEIKDKTTELNEAKAQEAAIKSVVSSVTTAALAACGAESLTAFEVPNPTLESATKAGKDLGSKGAKFLLDDAKENLIDGPITKAISDMAGLTAKITSLNNALGKLGKEVETEGDIAAAADVDKQQLLLQKSLNDYNTKRKYADNLKQQLRDEWSKLGKAMDQQSGGGEKFALLGRSIGECDAFFGQAQKVYDTIKAWEATHKQTNDKRDAVNSDKKAQNGMDMGLKAWEFILADPGKRVYGMIEHPIMIQAGSPVNSNEGQNPMQQTKVIKNDLRVLGKTLMDYRNNIVQNAMGINVPFPEVSFIQGDGDAAP